ncbi:MAG TPA: hypothetical protein VN605_06905 [Thermoanaerobaculia bacterium]|nr:hypothetical protein [Thermoanaerobaculia bacterium]
MTASAAPVIVEPPASESVAPPAPMEAPRPEPPPPVALDSRAQLRGGIDALLARDFPAAVPQLRGALDSPDLDERERQLARLAMAVSANERMVALAIARDLRGDPDADRIVHAFPGLFFRPRPDGPPRRFPRRP